MPIPITRSMNAKLPNTAPKTIATASSSSSSSSGWSSGQAVTPLNNN